MKTKPVLTIDDVRTILDAASRYAREHDWNVTISVVDDGGHLLGMLRLDGAAPLTAVISPGKARVSALGRRESGTYEQSINEGRYAYLSVPMDAMLEGGVPIVVDGQVVGAVGVSGVKSTQDVEIAKAGIAALSGR
ncbi:GlcG/HbpS family heme-binding protein [Castellaniella sp. S9]|uniref:GlcG/HbpS family heme-binding protein n=1 Tax=Castellaniella sp. S9 TaxID=2993652 RepID=UPI0022B369FE|nr:heme-binding protein [Castellaniella sp. S9]